jgi:RHS repeat-associated protein
MARTAPVPNFPAIPGMNPGIFIMGGGGDGGGSGAGGGKGKGKGQGANGKNGGNDANGGGKGAGACGAGSASGCPGGHGKSNVSAGDPVDVATGRVYSVPATDLSLPGPIDLVLTRTYSSAARDRDVGLGYGWAFTLGWSIMVRRRTIDVWNGNGTAVTFDPLTPGQSAIGQEGYCLRREADGFFLDAGDDLIRIFREVQQDGEVYRLTEVRDTNGNTIRLSYHDGRLTEIVDAAGRTVRVAASQEGRIAELLVKDPSYQDRWMSFAIYVYDTDGNLVSATDADRHETRYTYIEEHLLSSLRYPTGLVTTFRYDRAGRCVETWAEYPGRLDPSLDDGLSLTLADHEKSAKGIFHVKLQFDGDFVEVVNVDSVQRYFVNPFGKLDKAVTGSGGVYTRTYDERGHETSYTNALGATTQWERDLRGRILAITNPLGRRTELRRDECGRVVEMVDPAGHTTRYFHDERGNLQTVSLPLGITSSFEYDARGLVTAAIAPNGARTDYVYDGHGNCTEIKLPNGSSHRYEYDGLGRLVSQTTPLGATASYAYTNSGRLRAMRDHDGGVTSYEYDGLGNLLEARTANGDVYRLFWAGYRSLYRYDKPDGSWVEFRFDREGRLRRVRNERGGEHLFERDAGGRIVGEKLPDGRHLRFQRDAAGNIVKLDDGSGSTTEIDYDLTNEVIERRFADGTVEKTTLDERGDVIEITNGSSTVRYERNALRRALHETQIANGVAVDVDVTQDALFNRIEIRSSAGYSERIVRDAMGHVQSRILDGHWEIREAPDADGRHLLRQLPRGGRLESTYDAAGRLTGRRAVGMGNNALPPGGEAAWAPSARGASATSQHYRYEVGGELSEVQDSSAGRTSFRYGPGGHLDAVSRDGRVAAEYSYDPAGNLHEAGFGSKPRVYGTGNRLLSRGGLEYRYDVAGRLIEKRTSGTLDTAYTWDAKGQLESVKSADGMVVEMRYDPLGRRIEKQIGRMLPTGKLEVMERVRFVWDGDVLLHEIRTAGSGEPLGARTFAFEEGRFVPIAHRDGDAATGVWIAYFNDTSGTPVALVDQAGHVLERIERSPWGAVNSSPRTPLRFQGQYADVETGLHYNRYRYYDPEAGRYISPDALGLAGGFNDYLYDTNPVREVDPLGLITAKEAADTKADEIGKQGGQKPNCVTAVVDKATGTPYYGTPGEPRLNMETAHPFIKDNATGLPPGGIAKHKQPPENCGEPKAVDAALKAGAKPENREMHTVYVGGKKNKTPKCRCENCGVTTASVATTSDS